MNSKFLTALTFATVTFLSFSSIAKAQNAAQPVNTPESTAVVIQDKMQATTEANPQSEPVERNSTQSQADATNQDPRSSSGNYGKKCGE